MSPVSPRRLPTRVLIVLTAIVLLAHLAVLQAPPAAPDHSTPQTQAPRVFITRSVERAPARPAPTRVPVAQTFIAPTRQTQAAPTQSPDERLSIAAVANPQPQANQESTDQALSEQRNPPDAQAQAQDEPPADPEPVALAPRPPRDAMPTLRATAVPSPNRLSYQVEANKFPYSLNSELLWQHDGENYEARLEFSAFGQARVQTSRGKIAPEGLAPQRFSDKFRSEMAAHFDREKGKVTFSANTPDVPLLAGAQDRLTILVQLAALVASDPGAYPQATTVVIQTIGPRDADTWLFTVGREETLSLPGGELVALKLMRNPRREFDQTVELWLAPVLGYLPARIRITESNGAYVDQKWLTSEPPVQTRD